MSNTNITATSAAPPRFPNGVYKMRFTNEPDFKISKKENEMYVFNLECVEPATKIVDGVEVEHRLS